MNQNELGDERVILLFQCHWTDIIKSTLFAYGDDRALSTELRINNYLLGIANPKKEPAGFIGPFYFLPLFLIKGK